MAGHLSIVLDWNVTLIEFAVSHVWQLVVARTQAFSKCMPIAHHNYNIDRHHANTDHRRRSSCDMSSGSRDCLRSSGGKIKARRAHH